MAIGVSDQSSPKQFPLVQGLRAIAALSVAFAHIAHDALIADPTAAGLASVVNAMPWTAGVDVFFVISGFVITHSSRALFQTPHAAQRFLARRIARIVPLYWTMTTVFLITLSLLPQAINGAIGDAGYILKSYLFIPGARPDGLVEPPLGLGWTLNYEMFFYLVFALFLRWRQAQAVASVCAVLAFAVLAQSLAGFDAVALATWCNPIILEFCAGMLLALLPGRIAFPVWARAAAVVAAVIAFHLQPESWPRVIAQGLPAAVLVAAAALGKPARKPLGFVRLGDASYALYLVHPFVMRAANLIWQRLGHPGGPVVFVLLGLGAAQLAALLIYARFEKPTIKTLRNWLDVRTKTIG